MNTWKSSMRSQKSLHATLNLDYLGGMGELSLLLRRDFQ